MARQERRDLANMRAMEEEAARVTMRGSGRSSAYGGRMVGAGATPSMGLSQFRGGRRGRSPSPMDDMDDDELEGGFFGALASAARTAATRAAQAARAAAQRQAQATAAARAASARAAQAQASAQKPLLTAAQRAAAQRVPASSVPRGTLAQIASSAGKTGTALARDAPRLATQVGIGAVGKVAQLGTKAVKGAKAIAPKAGTALSRLGTVANVAIPAYMLADYLRSQQEVEGIDAGYYDDYAGEAPADEIPDQGADDGYVPPVAPPEEEIFVPEEVPMPPRRPAPAPRDKDVEAERLGLTRAEYDVYLLTGNLPVGRRRRGAGAGRVARSAPEMRVPAPRKTRMPSPPSEPVMRRPTKGQIAKVRGSGELTIHHEGGAKKARPSKATGRRAERAAIVKKVMAERGVKLGEASRIVKEEGLF